MLDPPLRVLVKRPNHAGDIGRAIEVVRCGEMVISYLVQFSNGARTRCPATWVLPMLRGITPSDIAIPAPPVPFPQFDDVQPGDAA
jgi:hypothetical protein